MKFGVLADLFEGAGAKVLTEVEINRQRSNQHEFQWVSGAEVNEDENIDIQKAAKS